MKNFVILTAFCFLLVSESVAQNAVLRVFLAHSSATSYSVYIPARPKDPSFKVSLKNGRNAGYNFKITHSEFVKVYFSASDNRNSQSFQYTFYLSPGDDLSLTADFDQPDFTIKVSGKGSSNNQPLIGQMAPAKLDSFYGDTLPGRVLKAIAADRQSEENIFNNYINSYAPTPSFVRDWRMEIKYLSIDRFYDFETENHFRIGEQYKRNYVQWKKATDSLLSTATLNNDSALTTAHYAHLLYMFLWREKERLWSEAYDHPEAFYREWYNTDTITGKKLYKADVSNLLQEKIINRYFSGRSAEYLYAVLFEKVVYESNPTNVPEIFDRFKSKYPGSEYIAQFDPLINAIKMRQARQLNDKFVFMDDSGTKFNSFNEVLAAIKGKTVLVDMWGTWCGPCREEIDKNTAAIHEYFKNKGLYYLYIANHESSGVDNWKKMIAYFNLEGMHIMANRRLSDEIMARVKGDGFPTVFLIKKDGTFELSKSPYPIKRDILIKQVEDALAE